MESTDPGSNWLENNDIQKVRHPEKLVFGLRDFRFPADYPEVRSLWHAAGPGIQTGRSDELEEIRKKVERDPDLFIIAENQGKVIGAVLGGFDGRRGIVYHLAVDPRCRCIAAVVRWGRGDVGRGPARTPRLSRSRPRFGRRRLVRGRPDRLRHQVA